MRCQVVVLIALLCLVRGVAAQQRDSLLGIFEASSVLQKHFYGFALYNLDSLDYEVAINYDKHFTPASNTKVFTLQMALIHLGDSIPGIAYVVRGDSLIFSGTGDPTFLHQKLDRGRVFEFLKTSPYQLYYAPQPNSEGSYRAGWAIEDYAYAYQPDLGVFPIYGNVVRFSERRGSIETKPQYFESKMTYQAAGQGTFSISRSQHSNQFFRSHQLVPRNFSATKPFVYSDELFLQLLQDTLQREVRRLDYALPPNADRLYSISTMEVLREMMLESDNFIAEQLHYIVSFAKYGYFDTQRLRREMHAYYQASWSDRVDLRDGSGLSFYNKVTPRSMVELLLRIKAMVTNESEFHALFAAGGVDGTLKNMYGLKNGYPYVWAKTGTVNSVHCQSGFVRTKSGKRYLFSFMNNNVFGGIGPLRKEMQRIMDWIYENK